jgi:hypothetical protein
MATEFRVILEDTLGTLAQLGCVLGDARVNIEAIHATSREGRGVVEFIPNDPTRAAQALDSPKSRTPHARFSLYGCSTSRACSVTWPWSCPPRASTSTPSA